MHVLISPKLLLRVFITTSLFNIELLTIYKYI